MRGKWNGACFFFNYCPSGSKTDKSLVDLLLISPVEYFTDTGESLFTVSRFYCSFLSLGSRVYSPSGRKLDKGAKTAADVRSSPRMVCSTQTQTILE